MSEHIVSKMEPSKHIEQGDRTFGGELGMLSQCLKELKIMQI